MLAMTATLMPGLSTQTQFARYYWRYWALADHAGRAGLDADACRRMIRRAVLLLAYATDQQSGRDVVMHGADAMLRGLGEGRAFWAFANTGTDLYSPRTWGFWGQHKGPSDTFGTVTTDGRALRTGQHACPPEVRAFFTPLLDVAAGTAELGPASLLPVLRPGRLAGRPPFDRLRRPVCPGADLHLVLASVLRPGDWRRRPAIPLRPRTPSPAPRRHRLRVPARLRADPPGGRARAGRVPLVRKYEVGDHGEYRTRRLVLDAYDRMTAAAAR